MIQIPSLLHLAAHVLETQAQLDQAAGYQQLQGLPSNVKELNEDCLHRTAALTRATMLLLTVSTLRMRLCLPAPVIETVPHQTAALVAGPSLSNDHY